MKHTGTILLLACGLGLFGCNRAEKQNNLQKTSYPTLCVTLSDHMLISGYSATIRGLQTVEIRPQVSGMITDILIDEGDAVRKDEILFIIDQRPYEAAYEIATANVASAEAALATTKLVLESNKELYEQQVVSEFELMTAQNDLAEAEAKLALAKAEETNAHNNLSYTEVRSPVNGVASMIPYRVGALVSSNITEPLVTVSDDSQVYAYFSMAENQMLDLIQKYGSLHRAIKELPEVELRLSNGQIYSHKGHIDAISGTISESTGAVNLRAVFPNKDRLLRDGSSGTILIPTTYKECIVIPQAATYEIQDKTFVYKVIGNRAVSTEITISPQNNGTEYIVTAGLQQGDTIISEGAGLVREGTIVKNENTQNE